MPIRSLLECRSRRERRTIVHNAARCVGACVISVAILTAAEAQILRVVTYNIAEDLSGSTGTPGTDLGTVLQGIGSAHLNSHAQPILEAGRRRTSRRFEFERVLL